MNKQIYRLFFLQHDLQQDVEYAFRNKKLWLLASRLFLLMMASLKFHHEQKRYVKGIMEE